MLYFVKFIYQTFLLPPGVLIVLLAVFAVYLRKKYAKISYVLMGGVFLFYLLSTDILADNLIRSLEKKYTPPAIAYGDVIIMLGGGTTVDTPNVNGKGHPSGFAANRLLTCVQLYYKLDVPIIVSGGQVYENTGTEAEISKTILMGLGVPKDKVLIEERSKNTTENARYTKQLMDNYEFEKAILVTSAFHMERSIRQFEKVGIDVIPYPTDYQSNIKGKIDHYDFIPSIEAMLKNNLAIKEYIGILVSKWY